VTRRPDERIQAASRDPGGGPTLAAAIDEAIQQGATGTVEADAAAGTASVDVVEAGPIGVKVDAVRVRRDGEVDVAEEAEALAERLHALGERVRPVEVEPRLGGATLRTCPEDMRRREFYQVDVTPGESEVRRYRVREGGREKVDWAMTREQLRRLVDELGGEGDEE
jgi:hypothetical protein